MRFRFIALLAMACLVLGAGPAMSVAAVQDDAPSPLAELGYPELRIVFSGGAPELPTELEAGRYHVVVDDETGSMGGVTFAKLPDGMTIEEAMADESVFYRVTIPGGVPLGGESDAVIDLLPGEIAVVVNVWEGDADPGVPQVISITGDASAVESATMPKSEVEADMLDFDFTLPETVAAGPGIWQITNSGEQPHELAIISAPAGVTKDQVLALTEADMTGGTPPADSPNPEEFVPIGQVAPFSTGQTVWVAFDLEPGTYIAICYVTDPESGMPHVMLGMIDLFTVE